MDEPPLEVDDALVVHLLRIRGAVTAEAFVESLGVHPEPILEALIAAGEARFIETHGVYTLLPAGRDRHDRLLAEAAALADGRLSAPYQAFLELNAAFKQLCTVWQLRDGLPNDHGDAEYDRRCTDELVMLHDQADVVLDAFASVLPRFARYRSRLRRAADAVAGGDRQMFTGVGCGSFHDIWMELHEDLVLLQRIDRTAEGSF